MIKVIQSKQIEYPSVNLKFKVDMPRNCPHCGVVLEPIALSSHLLKWQTWMIPIIKYMSIGFVQVVQKHFAQNMNTLVLDIALNVMKLHLFKSILSSAHLQHLTPRLKKFLRILLKYTHSRIRRSNLVSIKYVEWVIEKR